MTTMNIALPEELKEFIESQMASEGFASASECLRSLIGEAQNRRDKQALEANFREALESGPAVPMTNAGWAVLRHGTLEGLSGEVLPP
jgi:antitoxin ParD1/3/4